jgi:hypothetical protein
LFSLGEFSGKGSDDLIEGFRLFEVRQVRGP